MTPEEQIVANIRQSMADDGIPMENFQHAFAMLCTGSLDPEIRREGYEWLAEHGKLAVEAK